MTRPTLEREYALLTDGFDWVIAVDEVGRGALAGPVWVSAGAWSAELGTPPEGLRDSKLVPENKRAALADAGQDWLPVIASGQSEPGFIDRHGIIPALAEAGAQAVRVVWQGLGSPERTVVLLDGVHDWLSPALEQSLPVRTQKKADRDCVSVAAVSLVAKVSRDQLMVEMDSQYPVYDFARNKGYSSPSHQEALREHGPCAVHRISWIPAPELRFGED